MHPSESADLQAKRGYFETPSPTKSKQDSPPSDGSDEASSNVPYSPPRYVPNNNTFAHSNTTRPSLSHISIRSANDSHFQLNSALHGNKSYDAPESSPSGLHINTAVPLPTPPIIEHGVDGEIFPRRSASITSLHKNTVGHRSGLYASARSASPAGSLVSSPQLAAMADVTPLPSPIGGGKDPWKTAFRTRSRASSVASNQGSITSSPPRRKAYNGLRHPATDSTTSESIASPKDETPKSRSVSDYVPPSLVIPKPRAVAVSSSGQPPEPSPQSALHREEFLADSRGLAPPARAVSPQPSTADGYTTEEEELEHIAKRQKTEIYAANSIATGHPRKYRSIRFLGQGTFSRVFLAVRLVDWADDIDYSVEGTDLPGVKARAKRLVAVKVITHGPAGGADEERIEMSLKREVELLKSINHPSLVHLRAFGADEKKALLVLNFCPGGDLFDLASTRLELLVPTLVQRIFAEMVSAVHYLHRHWIVHRDIKLENVLLNVPVSVLTHITDWQKHDRAIVTLTDFGLSRTIPAPPESPLLSTRCGSEDYAAPEILMGQPYDGRQTDAWALGVMLYSLMEGRLPFDPLPGTRGDPAKLRARTPHRIARVEWAWYKFGDEDGDWDEAKGKEFEGARDCVDALLKRTTRRKDLDAIEKHDWVREAIQVPGGLIREEEHM